ncbi:MAG: 2,3-bisphosphoglycerate-independent phosphoglycerate mutase [Ruminococcaceae bacterium]|nr:2,3-bisphosphoglycerate-independent phosphoglycerate mutase [Oscillospiraceae bacterium]
MAKSLEKLGGFHGVEGPVLTIVMDGVGLASDNAGNAVKRAYTPTLDSLLEKYPWVKLKAHGTAVGLPSDDDMGNSEVGHNALGAGQVFAQGAKLVSNSIESGKMFESGTWKALISNVNNGGTLHFIGLFSDGNVHSHIDHLTAMLKQAKAEGINTVRVHILLDGRDVDPTSALNYVLPFESFLSELRSPDFDIRIASGGGRMNITMDRYEANWGMVEAGWKTHVLGEGRTFASAEEAINTYRSENPGLLDQDLPPFVIADEEKPVGTIEDGDSVIFFNFRGDRSIEISKAFDGDASFSAFDRVRVPNVMYSGMLEYDGDLHIPHNFLVNPPQITNTMSEYLCATGVNELAISETQKYGHVTYFWNGNNSGKFSEELETYIEIPSDVVPFEQRPWMKCADITDALIDALRSGKYRYLRVNFPNGDMVGHTGNIQATICSMEALDLQLARILAVIDELHGAAIITADHGNADEMYEMDKKSGAPKQDKSGNYKAKTSHTLNPVPCIIYDNFTSDKYTVKNGDGYGLSNVAATTVNLLGYKAPKMWDASVIEVK